MTTFLSFAIRDGALPLPNVVGRRELVAIVRWRRGHMMRRHIGRLWIMIAVGVRRRMRQKGSCCMMVWVVGRMGAVRMEGNPVQLVPSIVGN